MINLSKTLSWLCMLIFLLLACARDGRPQNAMLTIISATQPNTKIFITRQRNLYQDTLAKSKTDSLGKSSFEVAVQVPFFATIQIGKKYGEVYLAPGYNLSIKENGQSFQIPLIFVGEGAETNNCVSWVNSNVDRIRFHGKPLPDLDFTEFSHRYDSLRTIINSFYKHYMDSITLPQQIVSMLERKKNIKFLAVEQEYKFYRMNNASNKKWEAEKNGQNYMEGKDEKELENISNTIPLDTALLTNGYSDYQSLLNFYWHNTVDLPTNSSIGPKGSRNSGAIKSNDWIRKTDYPKGFREFFAAFNLRFWLAAIGITPETDSVLTDFKRRYPKSNYLPVLTRGYNEWLAIVPGKPAPEFEGYTLDGKKISIKDLKGKIVYIDVWATWCKPCVAEIPASKQLQQAFSSEDRIQFLNVSVDRKRSDWEKFLKKDKSWKGLHLFIEPEKIQSLYSTYKLFGVPDYILIDQSGNIVNLRASHPSDTKIKEEINQLLAKHSKSK
jgi:thiol-disulfide isomerase/thioredoxin